MGLFKKKTRASSDSRSRGMRITEGLLPVFGPAQIGDSTKPIRPVSEEEAAREAELHETLERIVAPDGTSYFVERKK